MSLDAVIPNAATPTDARPPVIDLQGVSKVYTKYEDTPALTNVLTHLWTRTKRSRLTAVQPLDLRVGAGETVGLIGRNGSGKSTLLQMMCGVTAPATGRIHVRGRIAPLISVGVGFHPELTGRENIYVNATILGLSREEIEAKTADIITFADITDFIDTPIKFYSSGMTVRLGFAVAAHASPDVLLVDEVLAVGDLPFQMKSFAHMQALRDNGTTIVVVSHNLEQISRLCERTVLLDDGVAVFDGPTEEAISTYHELLSKAPEAADPDDVFARDSDALSVLDAALVGADGRPTAHVRAGDRVRVRVRVRAHKAIDAPSVALQLTSGTGVSVYREHNAAAPFPALSAGDDATWTMDFDARLITGSYTARVHVARADLGSVDAAVTVLASAPPVRFYVDGRPTPRGVADLEATFSAEAGR